MQADKLPCKKIIMLDASKAGINQHATARRFIKTGQNCIASILSGLNR